MNKLICSFVLCCCSVAAQAQGPKEGFVMEQEGRQHLLTHPDPIYPPIAKAAHVQGDVLLHVDVDESGKVTKIEAIGGPSMLKAAAIDAVKQWRFEPFQVSGEPAAVRVVVSIPFSLGIPDATQKSDEAIARAFFPKETECRSGNSSHQWSAAVKPCSDLVAIANRFPDSTQRANEIRSAHEAYGEALIYSGDAAKALIEFQQSVEVANKSLTNVDEEYGAAYYWRAFAEHALKMPAEAERDYATAEASMRKAMANLPDMKQIYGRSLAHTLAFHSVLARQTGHEDESRKMVAEALQLDPHSMDGMGETKR